MCLHSGTRDCGQNVIKMPNCTTRIHLKFSVVGRRKQSHKTYSRKVVNTADYKPGAWPSKNITICVCKLNLLSQSSSTLIHNWKHCRDSGKEMGKGNFMEKSEKISFLCS